MGLKLPKSRAWREAKGRTRQELAEAAGLSPQTLAGYESGRDARPNNARKLADALGVEVAELMEESQLPKGLAQPREGEGGAARIPELYDSWTGARLFEGASIRLSGSDYWKERLAAGLQDAEVYALASFIETLVLSLRDAEKLEVQILAWHGYDKSHSVVKGVREPWQSVLVRAYQLGVFKEPDAGPEAREDLRRIREEAGEHLDALLKEHVSRDV